MLAFSLADRHHDRLRILCVGAHSDDIEIGCGGTILKLLSQNESASVDWVVLGASGERSSEAWQSAERFLSRAREKTIQMKAFRDGFFPYIGGEIKEYFEELKESVCPDVIFTHCRHDLHQDHRLVSELTWNTFRDHLVLEYEIIKYDGDLGTPNLFVHLDSGQVETKVNYLLDIFRTQRSRPWFGESAFVSIMRLRGLESNAPCEFAEGFYCRKFIWD